MAYRILVGSDFSEQSEAALSLAVTLAESKPDAEILLAHVIESTVPTFDEQLGVLEPDRLKTTLQALAANRRTEVPVSPLVKYGNPVNELLKIAKERQVDMIVIGTQGRTGLKGLLMGSVAQAVVRNSDCPVLTIKHPSPSRSADGSTSNTEQKSESAHESHPQVNTG